MSREIKFRAWDKATNKMHYQVNKPRTDENRANELKIQFGCTNYSARTEKKYIGGDCLMQFTGLLDKNGKEIFEGDILSHRYYSKPVICEFVDGSLIFGDISKYDKSLEVIGNIYENPELLGGKND
jgi:uncharacterized phage protein (TIGR01671 family)